jgi:hypothetical protein
MKRFILDCELAATCRVIKRRLNEGVKRNADLFSICGISSCDRLRRARWNRRVQLGDVRASPYLDRCARLTLAERLSLSNACNKTER